MTCARSAFAAPPAESKIPLFATRQHRAGACATFFATSSRATTNTEAWRRWNCEPSKARSRSVGATFVPLTVNHGDYPIEAYRFGSAAYLTDFSSVPEETMRQLEGLDILFLDALRHHPHPTHSTVSQSLEIVERLKPKRAFFTHISHDLPHEETNAALPANVRLSHDGLKLEFEL